MSAHPRLRPDDTKKEAYPQSPTWRTNLGYLLQYGSGVTYGSRNGSKTTHQNRIPTWMAAHESWNPGVHL